jgi:hypothetical protein
VKVINCEIQAIVKKSSIIIKTPCNLQEKTNGIKLWYFQTYTNIKLQILKVEIVKENEQQ